MSQTSQILVTHFSQSIYWFKITLDNFDKTVKPGHMSMNKQALLLHYVHAYNVNEISSGKYTRVLCISLKNEYIG